jgi:hypothetical protein
MPELTACTVNRKDKHLVPDHLSGSDDTGGKGADAREGSAESRQDFLNQGPVEVGLSVLHDNEDFVLFCSFTVRCTD